MIWLVFWVYCQVLVQAVGKFFRWRHPAVGFGLSALTTYLDNEYACCKNVIVVAARNSKSIVANVAVTTISVLFVSLLFSIV